MGFFDLFKKDGTKKQSKVKIYNPVDGMVQSISEVSDPVFSKKMMGDGFGVDPTSGDIYSPANAKVVSVFPAKHALGLKLLNNIDVLIHIGINTVELDGAPFEVLVEEGDEVTAETLLVKVDLDALKKAGKEDTVVVAFTNIDLVEDYSLFHTGEFSHGELIGEIRSKDS